MIAFALVERSESDDISPNSSRSSRKSFDKNADYFDLLRIHSVVQAFFIDTLTEGKEVQFWLERAGAVWCHSFDRADQKIREDSKVGLPDDYRRYAIHGRRLVEHFGRCEKKSPEFLGRTRDQIERRLKKIDKEIDQLSHTIQTHIIDGSGEVPPASVFERTNSSSESDSMTPPSHSGTDELGPLLDDEQQLLSPLPYDSGYVHNPYHWHVPYPHRPTMPPTPEPDDDDDDARTIVGSRGRYGGVSTPTDRPSFEPLGLDTGYLEPPQAYSDWGLAAAHHRIARGVEDHRYHERAGAWRDSTVSDPRVSISREIAKGSISGIRGGSKSPSGRSRVTAESEAELHLHKIRAASPPSPLGLGGGGYFDNAGNPSPGARPRPRLIMGANCYADPFATKTPENEYSISPAEFSTSLAKIAAAPSTWTAATMKRLKENLKSSRSVSDDQATAVAATSSNGHEAGELGPGDKPHLSPGSLFRGSRSSNSSPGSRSPPFPRPLPIDVSSVTPARHSMPATVRHWETHAYHPGLERLASSSSSYPGDPMSLSFPLPFPQLAVHPPPTTTTTQQPWIHVPGGYASQPATRDPSHKSSSPPNRRPSSASPRTHSPLADTPPTRGTVRSSRLDLPFGPRRRRSRRTRTRSHASDTESDGPSPPPSPPVAGAAGKGRSLPLPLSQSLSPTSSSSPSRGLGLGWGWTRGRAAGPGRRIQQRPASVVSGAVGAAPETRFARSEPGPGSGSGGFVLPDGRVVGFGDVVVPAPAPAPVGRQRLVKRAVWLGGRGRERGRGRGRGRGEGEDDAWGLGEDGHGLGLGIQQG